MRLEGEWNALLAAANAWPTHIVSLGDLQQDSEDAPSSSLHLGEESMVHFLSAVPAPGPGAGIQGIVDIVTDLNAAWSPLPTPALKSPEGNRNEEEDEDYKERVAGGSTSIPVDDPSQKQPQQQSTLPWHRQRRRRRAVFSTCTRIRCDAPCVVKAAQYVEETGGNLAVGEHTDGATGPSAAAIAATTTAPTTFKTVFTRPLTIDARAPSAFMDIHFRRPLRVVGPGPVFFIRCFFCDTSLVRRCRRMLAVHPTAADGQERSAGGKNEDNAVADAEEEEEKGWAVADPEWDIAHAGAIAVDGENTRCFLSECDIFGSASGVGLTGGAHSEIAVMDSTLSGATFRWCAIEITGHCTLEMKFVNVADLVGAGVIVLEHGSASIECCDIRRCGVIGVVAAGSSHVTVSDTSVELTSSGTNILACGDASLSILRCTITALLPCTPAESAEVATLLASTAQDSALYVRLLRRLFAMEHASLRAISIQCERSRRPRRRLQSRKRCSGTDSRALRPTRKQTPIGVDLSSEDGGSNNDNEDDDAEQGDDDGDDDDVKWPLSSQSVLAVDRSTVIMENCELLCNVGDNDLGAVTTAGGGDGTDETEESDILTVSDEEDPIPVSHQRSDDGYAGDGNAEEEDGKLSRRRSVRRLVPFQLPSVPAVAAAIVQQHIRSRAALGYFFNVSRRAHLLHMTQLESGAGPILTTLDQAEVMAGEKETKMTALALRRFCIKRTPLTLSTMTERTTGRAVLPDNGHRTSGTGATATTMMMTTSSDGGSGGGAKPSSQRSSASHPVVAKLKSTREAVAAMKSSVLTMGAHPALVDKGTYHVVLRDAAAVKLFDNVISLFSTYSQLSTRKVVVSGLAATPSPPTRAGAVEGAWTDWNTAGPPTAAAALGGPVHTVSTSFCGHTKDRGDDLPFSLAPVPPQPCELLEVCEEDYPCAAVVADLLPFSSINDGSLWGGTLGSAKGAMAPPPLLTTVATTAAVSGSGAALRMPGASEVTDVASRPHHPTYENAAAATRPGRIRLCTRANVFRYEPVELGEATEEEADSPTEATPPPTTAIASAAAANAGITTNSRCLAVGAGPTVTATGVINASAFGLVIATPAPALTPSLYPGAHAHYRWSSEREQAAYEMAQEWCWGYPGGGCAALPYKALLHTGEDDAADGASAGASAGQKANKTRVHEEGEEDDSDSAEENFEEDAAKDPRNTFVNVKDPSIVLLAVAQPQVCTRLAVFAAMNGVLEAASAVYARCQVPAEAFDMSPPATAVSEGGMTATDTPPATSVFKDSIAGSPEVKTEDTSRQRAERSSNNDGGDSATAARDPDVEAADNPLSRLRSDNSSPTRAPEQDIVSTAGTAPYAASEPGDVLQLYSFPATLITTTTKAEEEDGTDGGGSQEDKDDRVSEHSDGAISGQRQHHQQRQGDVHAFTESDGSVSSVVIRDAPPHVREAVLRHRAGLSGSDAGEAPLPTPHSTAALPVPSSLKEADAAMEKGRWAEDGEVRREERCTKVEARESVRLHGEMSAIARELFAGVASGGLLGFATGDERTPGCSDGAGSTPHSGQLGAKSPSSSVVEHAMQTPPHSSVSNMGPDASIQQQRQASGEQQQQQAPSSSHDAAAVRANSSHSHSSSSSSSIDEDAEWERVESPFSSVAFSRTAHDTSRDSASTPHLPASWRMPHDASAAEALVAVEPPTPPALDSSRPASRATPPSPPARPAEHFPVSGELVAAAAAARSSTRREAKDAATPVKQLGEVRLKRAEEAANREEDGHESEQSAKTPLPVASVASMIPAAPFTHSDDISDDVALPSPPECTRAPARFSCGEDNSSHTTPSGMGSSPMGLRGASSSASSHVTSLQSRTGEVVPVIAGIGNLGGGRGNDDDSNGDHVHGSREQACEEGGALDGAPDGDAVDSSRSCSHAATESDCSAAADAAEEGGASEREEHTMSTVHEDEEEQEGHARETAGDKDGKDTAIPAADRSFDDDGTSAGTVTPPNMSSILTRLMQPVNRAKGEPGRDVDSDDQVVAIMRPHPLTPEEEAAARYGVTTIHAAGPLEGPPYDHSGAPHHPVAGSATATAFTSDVDANGPLTTATTATELLSPQGATQARLTMLEEELARLRQLVVSQQQMLLKQQQQQQRAGSRTDTRHSSSSSPLPPHRSTMCDDSNSNAAIALAALGDTQKPERYRRNANACTGTTATPRSAPGDVTTPIMMLSCLSGAKELPSTDIGGGTETGVERRLHLCEVDAEDLTAAAGGHGGRTSGTAARAAAAAATCSHRNHSSSHSSMEEHAGGGGGGEGQPVASGAESPAPTSSAGELPSSIRPDSDGDGEGSEQQHFQPRAFVNVGRDPYAPQPPLVSASASGFDPAAGMTEPNTVAGKLLLAQRRRSSPLQDAKGPVNMWQVSNPIQGNAHPAELGGASLSPSPPTPPQRGETVQRPSPLSATAEPSTPTPATHAEAAGGPSHLIEGSEHAQQARRQRSASSGNSTDAQTQTQSGGPAKRTRAIAVPSQATASPSSRDRSSSVGIAAALTERSRRPGVMISVVRAASRSTMTPHPPPLTQAAQSYASGIENFTNGGYYGEEEEMEGMYGGGMNEEVARTRLWRLRVMRDLLRANMGILGPATEAQWIQQQLPRGGNTLGVRGRPGRLCGAGCVNDAAARATGEAYCVSLPRGSDRAVAARRVSAPSAMAAPMAHGSGPAGVVPLPPSPYRPHSSSVTSSSVPYAGAGSRRSGSRHSSGSYRGSGDGRTFRPSPSPAPPPLPMMPPRPFYYHYETPPATPMAPADPRGRDQREYSPHALMRHEPAASATSGLVDDLRASPRGGNSSSGGGGRHNRRHHHYHHGRNRMPAAVAAAGASQPLTAGVSTQTGHGPWESSTGGSSSFASNQPAPVDTTAGPKWETHHFYEVTAGSSGYDDEEYEEEEGDVGEEELLIRRMMMARNGDASGVGHHYHQQHPRSASQRMMPAAALMQAAESNRYHPQYPAHYSLQEEEEQDGGTLRELSPHRHYHHQYPLGSHCRRRAPRLPPSLLIPTHAQSTPRRHTYTEPTPVPPHARTAWDGILAGHLAEQRAESRLTPRQLRAQVSRLYTKPMLVRAQREMTQEQRARRDAYLLDGCTFHPCINQLGRREKRRSSSRSHIARGSEDAPSTRSQSRTSATMTKTRTRASTASASTRRRTERRTPATAANAGDDSRQTVSRWNPHGASVQLSRDAPLPSLPQGSHPCDQTAAVAIVNEDKQEQRRQQRRHRVQVQVKSPDQKARAAGRVPATRSSSRSSTTSSSSFSLSSPPLDPDIAVGKDDSPSPAPSTPHTQPRHTRANEEEEVATRSAQQASSSATAAVQRGGGAWLGASSPSQMSVALLRQATRMSNAGIIPSGGAGSQAGGSFGGRQRLVLSGRHA